MAPFQCCFCGETINEEISECLMVQVSLGNDATQELYAHAFCLRRSLHRSVPLLLKSETVVYVSLLNEGVEVWRPARAVPLNSEVFLLSPDQEVPKEEEWQFIPGQVVICKRRQLEDGPALVAVSTCEAEDGLKIKH